MERAELVELLSSEGLGLLDSLPTHDSGIDVLALVSRLRRDGHPPALVSVVLSQWKLRAKARTKFGDFASRMLFTAAGLEQATRLRVAAGHAGRFSGAGLRRIADLGCGIGADAMSFAALDLAVTAVDRDEVTAALASYNLAPFPRVNVVHSTAESFDLAGHDAAFLDPARRTAGHGETQRVAASDYSPSLDFAFSLAERMPVGVKLGPGLDRELIPPGCEAQWVSVDGQVVEMGLWFGVLARQGVGRSALVLSDRGSDDLTAAADSPDEPVGAVGEYLYEPDGTVIRARLIGDLARRLDAHPISEAIAYLSSDRYRATPFATGFRVLESWHLDERLLKSELRRREIGVLEIKKRGVDIDPAQLRKRLAPRGANSATLVLTRVAGRHTALLVERLD